MRTVFSAIVASLLIVATADVAEAASCQGVKFEETIDVGGDELVLNGMGIREATMFEVNVYVAGLYLAQKSGDGESVAANKSKKRLILNFVRGAARKKVVNAYKDSFHKVAGGQYSKMKPKLRRFYEMMGTVQKGDSHVFTYIPDKGVEVKLDGKVAGTIEGETFAEMFFLIWLGDHPPNQNLKKGLLGGPCVE